MSGSVSFIVPTLNRRGLVERAVRSCLVAIDRSGWQGQVSVLDSASDDGSWEALNREFADDPRVRLRQNSRGLGPTRSWLDGADDLSGEAVTFVWSDDYVAPGFIETLGRPVRNGDPLALGVGVCRPVDCAEPLPPAEGRSDIQASQMLPIYLSPTAMRRAGFPVSPVCALFSRRAFDHWQGRIAELSSGTRLRRELMWRRAIGPDLLLFLIALAVAPQSNVSAYRQPVAQLSAHPESITIGSSAWLLHLGYWTARVAFLIDPLLARSVSRRATAVLAGELLLQGGELWLRAPERTPGFESRGEVRMAIREELETLWQLRAGLQTVPALSGMIGSATRRLTGKLSSTRPR